MKEIQHWRWIHDIYILVVGAIIEKGNNIH